MTTPTSLCCDSPISEQFGICVDCGCHAEPFPTPKELSAKRLVVVNQLIDLTHKDPTADTKKLYERIAEMSWEIDASCQEARDFVTA